MAEAGPAATLTVTFPDPSADAPGEAGGAGGYFGRAGTETLAQACPVPSP